MPRPHAAALVEDVYHARKSRLLRRRGWVTRVVPSTGYGSVTQLRVFGRVILTRGRPEDEPEAPTYPPGCARWSSRPAASAPSSRPRPSTSR